MLRFLYHCFQAVLTLFWCACIIVFMVMFAAIGICGGDAARVLGRCP